jgi:hypothetical protein
LQFNITKLQLLEAEKQKLRREFERRESAIEVKKKACSSKFRQQHPDTLTHLLCT